MTRRELLFGKELLRNTVLRNTAASIYKIDMQALVDATYAEFLAIAEKTPEMLQFNLEKENLVKKYSKKAQNGKIIILEDVSFITEGSILEFNAEMQELILQNVTVIEAESILNATTSAWLDAEVDLLKIEVPISALPMDLTEAAIKCLQTYFDLI